MTIFTAILSDSAAAVIVITALGTIARKWLRRWARRLLQPVIDDSLADLVMRQAEFERRQAQHLDEQDREIREVKRLLQVKRG